MSPQKGAVEIYAFTRGRFKVGQKLTLPKGVTATLLSRNEEGVARLALTGFSAEGPCSELWGWLEEAGQTPLPPYIKRAPDDDDRERYQTVYAATPGAVAAPTAGLHFTPELLEALKAKGVEVHTLSLIVGPGTFAPVKAERIEDHHMHTERFFVPEETQRAVRSGKPVVAVGTTVVRALESWVRAPERRDTDIFITPGFEFQLIDGLITNFHLPQSTLLMLVSAFAGYELTLNSYKRAVEEGMTFYSYGDASLYRRPSGRWAR
jgi:S-adenosylmethionine:tRNA ribosyltransferase-isomerase